MVTASYMVTCRAEIAPHPTLAMTLHRPSRKLNCRWHRVDIGSAEEKSKQQSHMWRVRRGLRVHKLAKTRSRSDDGTRGGTWQLAEHDRFQYGVRIADKRYA